MTIKRFALFMLVVMMLVLPAVASAQETVPVVTNTNELPYGTWFVLAVAAFGFFAALGLAFVLVYRSLPPGVLKDIVQNIITIITDVLAQQYQNMQDKAADTPGGADDALVTVAGLGIEPLIEHLRSIGYEVVQPSVVEANKALYGFGEDGTERDDDAKPAAA